MVFLDDYSEFAYTKIQVPITLEKCPSDREGEESYIDVVVDHYAQQNCYIGEQRVLEFHVERQGARQAGAMRESTWLVTIILPGPKTEDEVIPILDDLCRGISLRCALCFEMFQYCGLGGFSYRNYEVKRSYAKADHIFGDIDFNHYCGYLGTQRKNSMANNVFALPERKLQTVPLYDRFCTAFMKALKCRDGISRYILLYYLFEIMYSTNEYRRIKERYRAAGKPERSYRSEILYEYIRQTARLESYNTFEGPVQLKSETLNKIITVRNNLTHRADDSEISKLMYSHLLPILQQFIKSYDADRILS